MLGALTQSLEKKQDRLSGQLSRRQEAKAAELLSKALSREESLRTTLNDLGSPTYLKASANGTLPAHARQIMYQARPAIQANTGQQLGDQYFCQTLLPDYIDEYGPTWDVVFDDRGHFVEPHTDRSIGLGTLSIQRS